ncbi:MAG: acyl-ACP--UDP-N-acetylglucosamine O-acyltransferase [Pontibacterium sp.]
MILIDPRAIIDPSAQIGSNVSIGPFTVVGAEVEIGSGSVIGPHVVLKGPTKIGKNNRIFQFASVGEDCQDKKYNGEPTQLIMGDDNVVREGVTIHRGTVQDKGITRIGSDNLFMANVHVAHDCVIGDHTTIANNTALAGHVHVGDWATLGGFTAVHQFCSIGAHAMCGVGSVIVKDIPAYVTISGNPCKPFGINAEGLRRRGFSTEAIKMLKRAYKVVFRQGITTNEALSLLTEMKETTPEVSLLIESIQQSQRGILR